jgi:predicted transcriptional regulator
MEKGHVTREREGKAFVYRAVSKPRKEFKKMTRRLADIFCAGSAKELIAQLIESERLTDDELKEIEAIATAKKKTTGKK